MNRDDWAGALRARMLDQRLVLMSGVLDGDVANTATMELMTLDASGDEPVRLQIESPTGSLDAALALMDVVELMGVDVHARAVGLVGGPALGVLAVARRRQATSHTRFHLAEPSTTFEGPGREVVRWAEERASRWERFCARVGEAVRRRPEDVEGDFATGRYLGADEARAYGLIDEVAAGEASIHRLPGSPMGFGPRN